MIVVDCSALVDALTAAPGTDDLRARLARDELHAPALVDYDVVAALGWLARAERISVDRAHNLLVDLDDLPLHRWPADDGLRRRALTLRHGVAAHDAPYVALAEALECPLVTRDPQLARTQGHAARIVVA